MKRLLSFVALVSLMLPNFVLAQQVTGIQNGVLPLVVTLAQPAQPQSGNAYPGTTVASVAVTVQSNSLANITGIQVQKVGSLNNAAIVGLQVNDSATDVVGTAGGFDANNSATIPITATTNGTSTKTFLVSVILAKDLTPYAKQSFELNITGVTSNAVRTDGALPIYGSQFTVSSGVPPPTCTLSSWSGTYTIGDTVNITWTSTNATQGSITGIGNVGPSGLQGILPGGQSQTLVGTFTGPGGTATCSISLTLTNAYGGVIAPGPGGVGGIGGTGGVAPAGNGKTSTPGTSPTGSGSNSGAGGSATPASNIIPCSGLDCRPCDLAALAQNIINYLIGLTIPLAAAMFAWAGILYFTSAANPKQTAKAKSIFKVVLWGFLIAISGYIVVQLFLGATLGPNYKSWNSIQCNAETSRPGIILPNGVDTTTKVSQFFSNIGGLNTAQPNAVAITTGGSSGVDVSTANGYVGQYFSGGTPSCPTGYLLQANPDTGSPDCLNPDTGDSQSPSYSLANTLGKRGYAQCSDGNPNCSIQTLLGAGLSTAQANAMSCIAITENAGNAVGCSGTGPCGTFQISRTNWQQYAPSQCQASNFGGSITAAQNNGQCNTLTMANMVQSQGYQPWTGNNNGVYWNTNARTCVNNYDPSNLH